MASVLWASSDVAGSCCRSPSMKCCRPQIAPFRGVPQVLSSQPACIRAPTIAPGNSRHASIRNQHSTADRPVAATAAHVTPCCSDSHPECSNATRRRVLISGLLLGFTAAAQPGKAQAEEDAAKLPKGERGVPPGGVQCCCRTLTHAAGSPFAVSVCCWARGNRVPRVSQALEQRSTGVDRGRGVRRGRKGGQATDR